METQTAFIRADGVVELDAVAGIHLHFAAVVDPNDLECETAVGFNDAFRDAVGFEFGVAVVGLLDSHQDLAHGLEVFALARVPTFQVGHQFFDLHNL